MFQMYPNVHQIFETTSSYCRGCVKKSDPGNTEKWVMISMNYPCLGIKCSHISMWVFRCFSKIGCPFSPRVSPWKVIRNMDGNLGPAWLWKPSWEPCEFINPHQADGRNHYLHDYLLVCWCLNRILKTCFGEKCEPLHAPTISTWALFQMP